MIRIIRRTHPVENVRRYAHDLQEQYSRTGILISTTRARLPWCGSRVLSSRGFFDNPEWLLHSEERWISLPANLQGESHAQPEGGFMYVFSSGIVLLFVNVSDEASGHTV